jgi:DNA invertase Pin-like site-specific DNA recombinase
VRSDAPKALPRAYSYARFSTPEQAKGDSLRRQTEAARAWAQRYGIELDTELNLTDKGISAYAGANMETGALGVFLEAVKEGVVPKGSWLLVESLDRISRQTAWDASYTMQGIVRAGVTVVDLSDGGREYNTKTLSEDPMALLVMVMMFSRANNESATKGMRVAGAFENKRRKFASAMPLDQPYTRRLPAWIRWSDTVKDYELIPDRAALVRRMFELTDEGWGQHRIAHWLNEAKEETWGAGGWKARYWHRSYIRKILTNRAVIGTFVPHRMTPKASGGARTRTPLDPIHDRLPAAIDKELFERVASRLSTTAARGRNTTAPARSIFAGIMKCRHCMGTVNVLSR